MLEATGNSCSVRPPIYATPTVSQCNLQFSPKYKDEVLIRYYAPYHMALMDAVLDNFGNHVLILDCHSFSPEPLPYEDDQSSGRPDVCIGTDEENTPKWLCDFVVNFFKSRGYTVDINRPYGGTIMPLRSTGIVRSLMIEVNRGLYLKPGTNEKSEGFLKLKSILFDLETMLLALLNSDEDILEDSL